MAAPRRWARAAAGATAGCPRRAPARRPWAVGAQADAGARWAAGPALGQEQEPIGAAGARRGRVAEGAGRQCARNQRGRKAITLRGIHTYLRARGGGAQAVMITLIVVLTTVAAALLLVGAAVYARVRRVRRKRDAEASERGGKHVRAAPAAVLLHAGMACRRSCSAEQCMSGQQGRAPPRSRACCLCPGARRTARAPRQHGGRPNLTLTHVRAARGRTRCCRPARSACRRSWWTARRSRACPATRAARRAAARATRRACTPTARLARRAAAARPAAGPTS